MAMKQDAPLPAGLIKKPEAAARLGVSMRFLDREIARRAIGFIKCGRAVRFDPRDIEKYIAARRVREVA